jgi:hypothetical protein
VSAATGRDDDGDGLPDAWEATFFGGTNISAGLPQQDWDRDGADDAAEFAAGTDPTNALDRFALRVSGAGSEAQVWFETVGTDGASLEGFQRLYALDGREGLVEGDWTVLPGFTNILGTNQTVIYAPADPVPTPLFLRGRVWLAPEP